MQMISQKPANLVLIIAKFVPIVHTVINALLVIHSSMITSAWMMLMLNLECSRIFQGLPQTSLK